MENKLSREEAKEWIIKTCGSGWLNLIDIVYDNKPDHISITEVFQKWGALTVRYDGEDLIFEELVDNVEFISKKMCEKCGLSGEEVIVGGITETLCEDHFNEAPFKKDVGEFIEGITNIYLTKYIDERGNEFWANKKNKLENRK